MTGRVLAAGFVGERTRELLGNTQFKRLYTGHAASKVGDELYFVAAMWLVHVMTGSTLFTGITAFIARFPGAVGFLVGPVVDRAPLRRLLVSAELAQAAVVLLVPSLRRFPSVDAVEPGSFAVAGA